MRRGRKNEVKRLVSRCDSHPEVDTWTIDELQFGLQQEPRTNLKASLLQEPFCLVFGDSGCRHSLSVRKLNPVAPAAESR